MDPVTKRIQRRLSEDRERRNSGMQVGMPKTTLDLNDVEYMVKRLYALEAEVERLRRCAHCDVVRHVLGVPSHATFSPSHYVQEVLNDRRQLHKALRDGLLCLRRGRVERTEANDGWVVVVLDQSIEHYEGVLAASPLSEEGE